jgi:glyoxylase-like metal-dependent hydrolase (beta-lactamase superfamily II)
LTHDGEGEAAVLGPFASIFLRSELVLTQVADGVWVRQSVWVWTNSIVVRGADGLILVDPGIDGSELNQLADDLDGLGTPVVAGFSTHPHWDHLLWHARFGDVPRYATRAGALAAGEARARAQAMAAESASDIPLELIALVTPLPADGGPVPGEIIEHQAHAVGHAAVLLADRGVLLAGDMLSDVLIPLLDARRPDQVGAYEIALDRLGEAVRHVDVLVPGHGAVAEGPEVAARLAADRAYIDALRRGEEPVDARLGPDPDWLSGPHRSNMEQARESPEIALVRRTWDALLQGGPDVLGEVLAPDAQWYGVEDGQLCNGRAAIVEVMSRNLAGRLRGRIEETIQSGSRVIVAFRPEQPAQLDRRVDEGIAYMVVTIGDGQIVEMKGCADRAMALSYVQADGRP